MQIQNNVNAPKFGMAMKIKPEAKPALEKASKRTLETLGKIGEDLKDTKYWHLSIGKDLVPTVEDQYIGRYTGSFSASQNLFQKEFYNLKTKDAINSYNHFQGKDVDAVFKASSPEEASDIVKNINGAKSTIESAAETVKALEKRSIRMAEEESINKKEDAKKMSMINDLISKYGDDK